MIGPDGTEWMRPIEVLELVPGLKRSTLDSWVSRGKVRRIYADPATRRLPVVALPDVLEHEAAATLAGWKRGRHAARTRGA